MSARLYSSNRTTAATVKCDHKTRMLIKHTIEANEKGQRQRHIKPAEKLRRHWKFNDSNNDGQIDKKEFHRAMDHLVTGYGHKDYDALFLVIDEDGVGEIQIDDLNAFFYEETPPPSPKPIMTKAVTSQADEKVQEQAGTDARSKPGSKGNQNDIASEAVAISSDGESDVGKQEGSLEGESVEEEAESGEEMEELPPKRAVTKSKKPSRTSSAGSEVGDEMDLLELKLTKLKKMCDKGLITKKDFEKKKQDLLAQM